MAKIDVSLEDLIKLLEVARDRGTVNEWIALIIDWATQAQNEIGRLRIEILRLENQIKLLGE